MQHASALFKADFGDCLTQIEDCTGRICVPLAWGRAVTFFQTVLCLDRRTPAAQALCGRKAVPPADTSPGCAGGAAHPFLGELGPVADSLH